MKELLWERVGRQDEQLGVAALLEWDCEIFGFPVAELRLSDNWEKAGAQGLEAWKQWCRERGVEVAVCTITPSRRDASMWLQEAGWKFVDQALSGRLREIPAKVREKGAEGVREAREEEWGRVVEIAGTAFQAGRYHADPRFPRELANRRYRIWMERLRDGGSGADRVYVVEESGRVEGFFHGTLKGETADLRLVAVEERARELKLGYRLFHGSFHLLAKEGAREVVVKFSAANTPMMNTLARFGFRFREPELIHHWHKEASEKRVQYNWKFP
ncbi:MAG: hypothetical protein FJW20_05655 [Acidimicrobiia bacterium]|nr:hypothetical protein [Acidimicrobiia bacterium]